MNMTHCIPWEGDEEQQKEESSSQFNRTPPFHTSPEVSHQWYTQLFQPPQFLNIVLYCAHQDIQGNTMHMGQG